MAAPDPNQDTGVYLEPVHQAPAIYPDHYVAQPYYTPDAQTGVYGTDYPGNPLYGPLPFQDYYHKWYNWPLSLMTIGRDWKQDMSKLNDLGYIFVQKLGSGAFGEVWRVRHTDTDGHVRELAGKVIVSYFNIGYSLKDTLNQMLNEVQALRGLQHPGVVSIESVLHIRDEDSGFPSLFIVIFMELCDGSLKDLVKQSPNGCFDEHQAWDWFTQIADALLYLHQHQVAHLDIKPHNILYKIIPWTNLIVYKLADFGLSKATPNQAMVSKTYGGTPKYMAPEARDVENIFWLGLDRSECPYLDLKAMDVYSLAVSLAQTLIGFVWDLMNWDPFPRSPGLDFDYWVCDNLIRSGKLAYDHPVIDLLSGMTQTDPSKRLTMDQVLVHRWLTLPSKQS